MRQVPDEGDRQPDQDHHPAVRSPQHNDRQVAGIIHGMWKRNNTHARLIE